jgi:hypothetical protein
VFGKPSRKRNWVDGLPYFAYAEVIITDQILDFGSESCRWPFSYTVFLRTALTQHLQSNAESRALSEVKG